MKRPGITFKLFLAVLATAGVVALGMGAAAHWSFSRGFLGYLNAQAVLQMEAAVPRLQREYREHGSWEFVRGRPGAWFRMTRPDASPTGDDPWSGNPERIASDLLGAGRRLSLLDEQRQYIIGFPQLFGDSQLREIAVDGRSVGWIALAPIESVTDAAALRFGNDQLRATLVAGVLALALAALIAWWIARSLLAPVREVAQATHRLAAGHFDTRVEPRGSDEVGQLAQDFNQLALTLARNEQVRREYMADISHELRTPLAVLRGELEAMEDGIHPVTPEGLRQLQAEVGMLSQLVTDLHELALADIGALTYHKVELDLDDFIARKAALWRGRCLQAGLRLEVSHPGQPVWLSADESRLRQLLNNLLGNALRYTNDGGLLRLSLRTDGGMAEISVEDSPPGVPDELLPRLFERFFRVERSRGRAGGGSGLGLAICRSIVQAHGGTIEARHSPLGGVGIHIRLPLPRHLPGDNRHDPARHRR
ncbi:MAG: HAMP domain-containing protein [Burkholderiales bacterium]|jgi:two-component system sensor histidine kinase BaeS|nr:HAMP domain-containing protein [Burkholderiales bacterium]MBP7521900.1 HAMP domain-containing protein [Leptothrix sp. (in: b-proteobacteria)]